MTPPFDSRRAPQVSPWSDLASNRSYQVAAIRAAIISLVLLVALASLVLF
ncbi:MAG: hypothetical protein KIH64_004885 [Mycobacterium sp.]|nr:hypothetical protein [Mycobacterium sp.]